MVLFTHSRDSTSINSVLSDSSSDVRGSKRSLSDSLEASVEAQGEEEPQDGLKIWGYMRGHVHYKVGPVDEVGKDQDR